MSLAVIGPRTEQLSRSVPPPAREQSVEWVEWARRITHPCAGGSGRRSGLLRFLAVMSFEEPVEEKIAVLEREVAEAERELDVAVRALRAAVVESLAVAPGAQFEEARASFQSMQAERGEAMTGVLGFVVGATVGGLACTLLLSLLRMIGIK